MENIGKFFSRLWRLVLSFVFFFLSSMNMPAGDRADPSLAAPIWPEWVHQHWVWENVGTEESAMQLVQDYIDRDVPVGAIIIDRPWDTEPNTFDPDPERYPNLESLIGECHDMDVRVIMWATSVINENASTFQYAKDKGYFLSGGKTVKWWAGNGAFIDYTNPEAVEWWHGQMDKVLDMGIDGWKVDGSDPYMMLLFPAIGKGGLISWSDYKDQVYGDFFNYSREKLGNDRVISARPVDDQLLNIGLPLTFASKDVNFAGWVGDNDNDWGGLQAAINSMFSSAQFGYVSYGSDIGGFRSDGPMYKDVFTRWAQLGAFCPIMENGGGGEHRPWLFDENDETLDIYRDFVILHTELIPYIYSQAAYSYELGISTMRPQRGDYIYLLGDDILVAPFVEEGTKREVRFPAGEWIYMFDEAQTYTGGKKTLNFGYDEFPAFIRKGAIVPMDITSSDSHFGTEACADYTTIMMYPENGEKKFGLYEENKTGTMISYTMDGSSLAITATESNDAFMFRVYNTDKSMLNPSIDGIALTQFASLDALAANGSGYFTDGDITWIAVSDVSAGTQIQVICE